MPQLVIVPKLAVVRWLAQLASACPKLRVKMFNAWVDSELRLDAAETAEGIMQRAMNQDPPFPKKLSEKVIEAKKVSGKRKSSNLTGTDVVLCTHEKLFASASAHQASHGGKMSGCSRGVMGVKWEQVVVDARKVSCRVTAKQNGVTSEDENNEGIHWHAILRAAREARHRIILTGGAAEQSCDVEELAGMAAFVAPSAFGSVDEATVWGNTKGVPALAEVVSSLSLARVGLSEQLRASMPHPSLSLEHHVLRCCPPPTQTQQYLRLIKGQDVWRLGSSASASAEAARKIGEALLDIRRSCISGDLPKASCLAATEGPSASHIATPTGEAQPGQAAADAPVHSSQAQRTSAVEQATTAACLKGEDVASSSGKLVVLKEALKCLSSAGKRAIVLSTLPEALSLADRYLHEAGVPHECCGDFDIQLACNGGKGDSMMDTCCQSQCALWRFATTVRPRCLLTSPQALENARGWGIALPQVDAVLLLDDSLPGVCMGTLLDPLRGLKTMVDTPITLVHMMLEGTIEESFHNNSSEAQSLQKLQAMELREVLLGPNAGKGSASVKEASEANGVQGEAMDVSGEGDASTAGIDPLSLQLEGAFLKGGQQACSRVIEALKELEDELWEGRGVSGVRLTGEGDATSQGNAAKEAEIPQVKSEEPTPEGSKGGAVSGDEGTEAAAKAEAIGPMGSPAAVSDICFEDMVPLYDTPEASVFGILAAEDKPTPPDLLFYFVDGTRPGAPGLSFLQHVGDMKRLGILHDPVLYSMPRIDAELPQPDPSGHTPSILHDIITHPSWMKESMGKSLGCTISLVDKPPVRKKMLKKAKDEGLLNSSRTKRALPGGLHPKNPKGTSSRLPVRHVDMSEGWTPLEDAMIVAAVEKFGTNWMLVAFLLNKDPAVVGRLRSGVQCKERHTVLSNMPTAQRLSQPPKVPILRASLINPGDTLTGIMPERLKTFLREKKHLVPPCDPETFKSMLPRFNALVICMQRKPEAPGIPGCDDPKVPLQKAHPSHHKAAMDVGATQALAPTQVIEVHRKIEAAAAAAAAVAPGAQVQRGRPRK
ncbi:unnamed protein product [Chrysoparadoxa australica]